MNRVYIVLKDGKIMTGRSTMDLAKIAVNISQKLHPKSKFEIEEVEIPR